MSQAFIHVYNMEQIKLPHRLRWAITIHKSAGFKLNSAWIDLGMNKKIAGLLTILILETNLFIT